MRKLVPLLTVGLAIPFAANAATPTLGEVFAASGIVASGYVDTSFTYNNRSFNASPLTYGGASVDSFSLNQVGLSLAMQPASGFGGVIEILGGHDAGAIPSDGGGDIILKQAYAQYANGGFTLIGGRFLTLAGAEVINDTQNSNATRSLLFGIQPLSHTGVRASYKVSDALTGYLGLNNSYGGATQDNNKQKTIEASVALAPIDNLTIAVTDYYGNETPADRTQNLVDLVANLQATKQVAIGLNADYLRVDDAVNTKNKGVALYGNVQWCDVIRTSLRLEYLKTDDNTSFKRKQKEATLTGGFTLAKNFDLLGEVRYDKDDTAPFDAKDSMVTLTAKALYKFGG